MAACHASLRMQNPAEIQKHGNQFPATVAPTTPQIICNCKGSGRLHKPCCHYPRNKKGAVPRPADQQHIQTTLRTIIYLHLMSTFLLCRRREAASRPGLSDMRQPCHVEAKCFARMRSKGSRFILGVWGLRLRSPNVAQPFATVRLRSREARMATPMASFAKGVHFGCFKRRVASLPVAGVALCDIQSYFTTCQKSLCVAGAILSRPCQKMRCSFRPRRSTLETSIVILRGRRSTSDVSCCVFFLHFTLHTLHLTRYTLQSALRILHSILCT